MNKFIITVFVASSLFLCFSVEANGVEKQYLDNGENQVYMGSDATGDIFIMISSITLEDIFKDGLALQVTLLRQQKENISQETIHLRMADDGSAWIQKSDGWYELSKDSGSMERQILKTIRQDMGSDAHRQKYLTRIAEIWDNKNKAQEESMQEKIESHGKLAKIGEESLKVEYKPVELDSVVPIGVKYNSSEKVKAEGAIKKKGQVKKEKPSEKSSNQLEQVEIIISEHPVVEIISRNK